MFAWAGDDQYTELCKKAGFNPVPLPSTEIATALQTGLVNAITISPQGVLLMQWYKQLHYMTDFNWAVFLGGIVITKSAWEKIPVEIRPASSGRHRRACQRMREFLEANGAKDLDALKRKGSKLFRSTRKVLNEWRRLIESVLTQVRGSYVPADSLDTALKLRDQCRRQAE